MYQPRGFNLLTIIMMKANVATIIKITPHTIPMMPITGIPSDEDLVLPKLCQELSK